jgi:hypothetical protein
VSSSDFDVWKEVAQAAFDRRLSCGADSLTRLQKVALTVWSASGMIGNRGFVDHSPEEMAEWADAYDALEITAAAEAIREAAKLMPTIDWTGEDPAEQQLDAIERRYYDADKHTEGAVAALIRKHPAEAFAGLV